MPAYQVTGNEYVSLPAIREDTGAVQGLTVLHMGAKGLLELCGGDAPLIAPWCGWRGRRPCSRSSAGGGKMPGCLWPRARRRG